VRRAPAVLVALAIALSMPTGAQADDVTFDNGYDPGSPAGKQYAIPAAGVVRSTKVKPASNSGSSVQSADTTPGIFGAGLRAVRRSPGRARVPARRRATTRRPVTPDATRLTGELGRARSEARSGADSGAALTSIGLGIGGFVLLTAITLAVTRTRRRG
jgi:hypothetical protein